MRLESLLQKLISEKNYVQAIEVLNRILKQLQEENAQDPALYSWYLKRAQLFSHINMYQQAINDCEIASSIPNLPPQALAQAHHNKGELYLEIGDLKEAEQAFLNLKSLVTDDIYLLQIEKKLRSIRTDALLRANATKDVAEYLAGRSSSIEQALHDFHSLRIDAAAAAAAQRSSQMWPSNLYPESMMSLNAPQQQNSFNNPFGDPAPRLNSPQEQSDSPTHIETNTQFLGMPDLFSMVRPAPTSNASLSDQSSAAPSPAPGLFNPAPGSGRRQLTGRDSTPHDDLLSVTFPSTSPFTCASWNRYPISHPWQQPIYPPSRPIIEPHTPDSGISQSPTSINEPPPKAGLLDYIHWKGLWVGSVKPDLTKRELKSVMENYGVVTHVDVFSHSNPVFAYVDFADSTTPQKIYFTLKGRPIPEITNGKPIELRFRPSLDQEKQLPKDSWRSRECKYWLEGRCHGTCKFVHIRGKYGHSNNNKKSQH